MANIKSAKKRIIRNEARREINHSRMMRIRTFIKQVEKAVASGNKDEAVAAFRRAQPEVQRGVTKGVLHWRTASRRLSRLSAQVKAMA